MEIGTDKKSKTLRQGSFYLETYRYLEMKEGGE